MTLQTAFEIAMAKVMRKYAQLGAGVVIRAWRSLRLDGSWNEELDREFPMLGISASTPGYDDGQRSMYIDVQFDARTQVDDDQDHAVITEMETEVQRVLDIIFDKAAKPTITGAAYDDFVAYVDELATCHIGGMTYGEPSPPVDDGNTQSIQITMRVHYSRRIGG